MSYVVNNTRPTRPETAERVRAAARHLGYSLNAAPKQLAAGKSSIFGIVISDIRNPFFPEIVTAFHDQALLRDLDTVLMITNYDSPRTRTCVQRLLALRVPGVAVLTSQIDDSIIDVLADREVAAAYLDLGRVDRWISNIVVDYEHGICEALEHLRDLGHKDIGYIGGPPHRQSALGESGSAI